MGYRLRDMANGKFMDELRAGDEKHPTPTWSATGHFFPTQADLAAALACLRAGGTKVSPLWEVQECTVTVGESFPALALQLGEKKK